MQVIGLFIVCALILDTVAVGICSVIERFSSSASLLAFLGFFVVNFVIAWHIALYLTEKYLVSDAQRRVNEDHVKWVNAKFAVARR